MKNVYILTIGDNSCGFQVFSSLRKGKKALLRALEGYDNLNIERIGNSLFANTDELGEVGCLTQETVC